MATSVDYMNSLSRVAGEIGSRRVFGLLEPRLKQLWLRLETQAQEFGYDVLSREPEALDILVPLMNALAEVLYEVPGAAWEKDVEQLIVKDRDYGGSWCRRGGQGAFMMMARKWDRVEKAIETWNSLQHALEQDTRQEGVLDDLGDLRRYLLLVLSWHREADHADNQ